MNLPHRCLTAASLLLLVTTGTLAQDDTDLIDDLPKERKEATREKPQLKKRVQKAPASKPQSPNVDLIDDLSPEQKEAAERNAARKNENAIPDNLADALARALRNSPAILVADAKVRQAQAELNEVRLNVVQELTLTFQRRALNKAVLEGGRGSPQTSTAIMEDETRILYLLGVGAEDSADAPHLSGRRSKASGGGMMGAGAGTMQGMGMGAAQPMGMMPGMSAGMGGTGGMGPTGGGMGAMMPGGGVGMAAGMMGGMGGGPPVQGHGDGRLSDPPENVRTFLNKRVDVNFQEQPIQDVLDYLQQAAGGGNIAFVIQDPFDDPVTLSLKQVTVQSILQAVADLHHCAFVFRDYGILVLGPDVEGSEEFESFRAAGTPMIAPPSAAHPGGAGMGGMM